MILDKQQRAELVALGYGTLAAAVLILALLVLGSAQPAVVTTPGGGDPFAPTAGYRAPRPGVTGSPLPSVRVPVAELIVQQNDQCWIGVPGATCDPAERTYN